MLLLPAVASVKFRVACVQTQLRPSSEEHGHPLVGNTERNACALQRHVGWEAARGAAEGLLVSPEPREFRPEQGSFTTQMELSEQSFVLFLVCHFSKSIQKHLLNNLTLLLFHALKSMNTLTENSGKGGREGQKDADSGSVLVLPSWPDVLVALGMGQGAHREGQEWRSSLQAHPHTGAGTEGAGRSGFGIEEESKSLGVFRYLHWLSTQ